MKKYLAGAALSLGILASPAFTQAATLSDSQVQAILAILSSFGADSTTIASVQSVLTGGTPTTSSSSFCHNFNSDLTVGSRGDEVLSLNKVLALVGFDTPGEPSTFDENTASVVVSFQARYGIRQTGYVGPLTRAKLNALYGCGSNQQPTSTSLSDLQIISISPTTVQAGQMTSFTATIKNSGSVDVTTPFAVNVNGTAVTVNSLAAGQTTTVSAISALNNLGQNQFCVPVDIWNTVAENNESNNNPCWSVNVTNATTQSSITVTAPNGGGYWYRGEIELVEWRTANIPQNNQMIIRLRGVDTNREYNLTTTSNDGSENIPVPSDVPAGAYTLEIKTTVNGQSYLDASDSYFKVVDPTLPIANPVINSFSASPTTITAGNSSTLTWSASNTAACGISVVSGGAPSLDLSKATNDYSAYNSAGATSVNTGTLTQTATYELRCAPLTGASGGYAVRSVTVTVTAGTSGASPSPAATTATLTQSSASTPSGTAYTLTWSSSNATSCTVSYTGPDGGATISSGSTSGSQTFTTPTTGTYVATNACTGPGGTNSATVTHTVTAVATPNSSPIVSTSAATNITSTSVILNGKVNSAGTIGTTGWFRGSATNPGECNDTFGVRIPATGNTAFSPGYSSVAFSEPVTGLNPGTTYYFCAIASNSFGKSYGNIASFTALLALGPINTSGLNQTASALNALAGATQTANGSAPVRFSYTWNRDLQIGSPYAEDVRALQTALTREGVYSGESTGGFYNQTFAAVKAFQQKYGIEATGFVGPDTRAKLNTLY